MAKSKEQKQLEAKFREVRGSLVDAYREVQSKHTRDIIHNLLQTDLTNLDPKVLQAYKNNGVMRRVEQIKKLKEEFSSYPLELQINGFKGWSIEDIEDLKLFRIEIERKHIASQISHQDSFLKTKKRI